MRSVFLALALLAAHAVVADPLERWNFGKGEVAVGDSANKVTEALGKPDKVEIHGTETWWYFARNDRNFIIAVGPTNLIVSITIVQ